MRETGFVQESLYNEGVTSVSIPPNPTAWLGAKPGTVFVEFDVPSISIRAQGNGWGKIWGPNSIFGGEMPQATQVKPIITKQ